MNGRQIELELHAVGERLDKALADVLSDLSRTQVQQLIREGQVTLNDKPVKGSLRLEGGEQVVIYIPELVEAALTPETIPLEICYEDEDCILVNKAAGMVVHPSTGHQQGTLVNAILAHCPDIKGVGGVRRPGIVHRLDKDTSGLIIVAKSDHALRHLQNQFKARTVRKAYLALVEGIIRPSTAIIDAPLGRDPRARKKMSVVTTPSAQSRPAQTQYSAKITYDDHTLVECLPHTGRTHQIRVHLAYIGYPIVGDRIYGRRKLRISIKRHFLHATELSFKRPSDNQELTIRAELPQELQTILDNLAE